MFIAFEGGEGCGKSTQAKLLAERLGAVLTREPGATEIGAQLRQLMLSNSTNGLAARAEALLMAADRAQHIAEVVQPALDRGQHVVSDRSIYSTLAYQGYGRQLGTTDLLAISTWALNGRLPDVVVFISVPTEILNERLAKRNLDRFEREGADFFARINDGFTHLRQEDPDRWIEIDGTMSKDDVETAIRTAITARLTD